MQCQQLKDLQEKTHKDLWIEDLDKFMEELDVNILKLYCGRYDDIFISICL